VPSAHPRRGPVATSPGGSRVAHRPPDAEWTVDRPGGLVRAVSATATTDTGVVATVTYLVNSGTVRLCGNFRGARIDLDEAGIPAAA